VKLDVIHESIPVYLDAAELKQVIVSLGLALTPPINLEAALEQKQARLTINGLAAERSPALLMAQTFAERNDAAFAADNHAFTFRIPEANFTETDRQSRSILLVADDGELSFKVADLLRRNTYEVVIGARDLLDSPDYRFEGTMELSGLTGDQEILAAVNRLFGQVA
jgi:hypothetical protein